MILPHYWGNPPKESQSSYRGETPVLTFEAGAFITAKLWNQPRCLPSDE